MRVEKVGRLAGWFLVVALGLAVLGLSLARAGIAPFWGRMLAAFGEAALVGGLADWFAVTALFQKPLGFPFHTALIPRKRRELSLAAGDWVQQDLLPRERLKQQIAGVDFASRSHELLTAPAARVELRRMLRTVLGDALGDVDPKAAAAWLARLVSAHLARQDLRVWLTGLVGKARREDWFWPVAREWFGRLGVWARTPQAKVSIGRTVHKTWAYYREEGTWLQRAVKTFAEVTPLVDLDQAAAALRELLIEFCHAQQKEEGELYRLVKHGVESFGQRLGEDDAFYERIQGMVLGAVDEASLASVLEPVLRSVRADVMADLAAPNSPTAEALATRIERWMAKLSGDPGRRAELNRWISRRLGTLVDRHHAAIGLMVREQLDRLPDEHLVGMIKDKTGNDLNWIRINGAIVGGGIGLALFLIHHFVAA
jgi:uncharacterized membrane-anchored protein YjiN (DUF445 family)